MMEFVAAAIAGFGLCYLIDGISMVLREGREIGCTPQFWLFLFVQLGMVGVLITFVLTLEG